MSLTQEDVVSILKIIDESPYEEVRLEIGDLKLHVRRHGDGTAPEAQPRAAETGPPTEVRREAPAPGPVPAAAPAAAATAAPRATAQSQLAEGLVAVRAPMLGTFYRASAPGEPPFVEVGDKVRADDTVCLVEVMKLFNSVKAGVEGTVVKIAVDNGSMVEHGQVLILIESDRHTADAAVQ